MKAQSGRSWHFRLRVRLAFLSGLAAALIAQAPALAQDYPSRPITMIVPTGPGGGMELLARILTQRLEQRLGKPFVIENRAGGGGTIGTRAVAKAAPDGYTLLVANSSYLATNVTLFKHLPYDPVTELMPIALHAYSPWVLVVNPSLPVHSAGEFVKLAKSKPGELTFGSGGPGSAHHLFGEMLKTQAGIDARHIPYRSTLQPLNDVVAGHLDFMFTDLPPSLNVIKSGKVRALGVSPSRAAVVPEIPVLSESIPGFEPMSWHMILAPAGTPPAIINRLHSEIKSIMALPEVKQQFEEIGQIPIDSRPPNELQEFIKSEIVRWAKIVQDAGVAASE
jgi:tripartite-type tricarboxylate transporter receptor subunit TctC